MRREQIAFPALRFILDRPKLAELIFRFDKWGNALGPERYSWPYPIFDRMRSDGPVVYRANYQLWFVLGYDEARHVLSSDSFGVEGQRETLVDVRPYSQLSKRSQRFFGNLLLLVDPPRHTRLRRLVSRAFTPAQVRRLEPAAESLTAGLLAAIADDPNPDIVSTFAEPLPINLIMTMLGVPEDKWPWLSKQTDIIAKLINPFKAFDLEEMDESILQLHDYFLGLAGERRADPGEDVLTALGAAEDDGDRLTSEELVAVAVFLMVAGHRTTSGMIGNAALALAKNPEQRDLVRRNPDLWPNAIEELLRYDSAVPSSPRSALEDVEVGGHRIKKGQNVLVFVGAANRDPNHYDRADELVLDREDPRPLSFGHGPHHCLGHALARMELRVALPAFVEAFGDYAIDEPSILWDESLGARGPVSMRVKRG